MQTLKIANWDKWQSYRKDRGQPPWIKVHRRLLRNLKWINLTDAQRGQLVAIWLLAGDHDGVIPASSDDIQKLCFLTEPPDLQFFIEQGFIENDANMTPTWRQHDAPKAETKAETEEKRREEPPTPQGGKRSFEKPTIQDLEGYKMEIGFTHFDPQAFIDFYESKGWFVGKNKMKCWKSAVRTWQRRMISELQKKHRLLPLPGKSCGKCGMPAVYKSAGEFDHYYCEVHMPEKIKRKYCG